MRNNSSALFLPYYNSHSLQLGPDILAWRKGLFQLNPAVAKTSIGAGIVFRTGLYIKLNAPLHLLAAARIL
jgi:hypothetical protein